MKLVLCVEYGGFEVPDELYENEEFMENYLAQPWLQARALPQLVEWAEAHPTSDLGVVEIPDDYTDYYADEYDGLETLLYVQNGLIHMASEV